MFFTPQDWYWHAPDGRVYGSERMGPVADPATDETFIAWTDAGNVPTPWPKDGAGQETVPAIQAAVDPFGASVTLAHYAAAKRFAVETGGISFAGGRIATDRESQAMINGAFALAKDDPTVTIKFKSGSMFATLSADQMLALGRAVAAHVQACFAAEAAVVADLAGDPATITSTADIDAYAWPSNA